MKRLLAPLALTLGLMLVVAAAASLRSGPANHTPQSHVASLPAGPAVADVAPSAPPAQATADSTAPAVQAENPAPKTGCGKAVPCANRDCTDCPANRYLK